MLRYLKERMMPAMPEKTEAERTLESVEQGALDRQARQQAEADAQAQAERTQRLQMYRERQAVAMALVHDYTHEAEAFDAKLAELVPIVERMSALTRQIEHERSLLWSESRAVGDDSPGVHFSPKEWFVEATGALRHAWTRGQHGS